MAHEETPPPNNPKGKIVLVAIDRSDHSLDALRWALHHLTRPDDAVVLLHSQHVQPIYSGPAGPGFVTAQMLDAIRKQEDATSREILAAAKKICDELNVKTTAIVSTGDPREHICEAVEKVNADVLVVGSHGYGSLKRAFLGSVSDYCAHHAKCPIVIVKKHAP